MIELVLAASDADALREHLVDGDAEGCAVLFAGSHERTDGLTRLLVREVEFAAP
jgi:hypothetical protein